MELEMIMHPKPMPSPVGDDEVDPFGLIPRDLPPHPRVFVTPQHIAFTREHLAGCPWRRAALALLLERSAKTPDFHDDIPLPLTPDTPWKYENSVLHAVRNALTFHLTRQSSAYHEALRSLRMLAAAYARRPLLSPGCRAVGGGDGEMTFISWLACAVDLLAAEGFDEADRRLFDEALEAAAEVIEGNPHRTCSNHNTWAIRAGMSVAAARGDRQGILNALYGQEGRNGRRYGFIHQLQHDLLADGIEWEHNLRHHLLTLVIYADVADRCRNFGIDLWRKTVPAALGNEGADRHRDYGPPGEKSLKAAFDAPLYQLFPSGEFPLFGDSRLSHLRGLATWGIFYNLAYEAYEDPRHAWLLARLEQEHPVRPQPLLPATLQTPTADLDFARLLRNTWPEGRFSLGEDSRIGLTGQHCNGCSHLPANGSTMLRTEPDDPAAPAAFIFWGPHSAGHQGPGGLNLELYAGGRRLTDTPWSASFDDPLHLDWCRTTIAHNTVTVDESSMYPYDKPTESIWESDEYHGRPSDGRLIGFWPVSPFKAVRACNEAVYPGVRLDRALVVGPDFILDLFRCVSDAEHQYDWALHFPAEPVPQTDFRAVNLGEKRGYRQLRNTIIGPPGLAADGFTWTYPEGILQAELRTTVPAQAMLARSPEPTADNGFPGSDHRPARACSILMSRCKARSTAFAALFTFGRGEGPRPHLQSFEGSAETDLRIDIALPGGIRLQCLFPMEDAGPVFERGLI